MNSATGSNRNFSDLDFVSVHVHSSVMVICHFIQTTLSQAIWNTDRGRLAVRLLAGDSDIKPRHFGDVMSTGKLLSLNVYFQIEMEN
jgi:hypothetical protein